MPSKKTRNTRAAQLHPLPAQSDFEDTDTANVTTTMSAPPQRTNTELNLKVLRQYVSGLERIVSIAPFAVVYVFSPETQQWEKSGIEGTLFVCQLTGSPNPRYNVVILNRKSLDNFITELVSEDDIEITEQYVILQVMGEDDAPTIYGLWIFSDEGEGVHSTRAIVANSIQECAMRAAHANLTTDDDGQEDYEPSVPYTLDGTSEQYAAVDEPLLQPATSGQQIDLLSLFGKPAPMEPSMQNGRSMELPNTNQGLGQPHFLPAADTGFFRSASGPAVNLQAQTRSPAQPNPLLALFRNPSHG